MASSKKNPAMDFIVTQLRRNSAVSYATVKERAEAKRLTVYPIMYGRAKALLGLVPTSPRGQGGKNKKKAAKRVAAKAPPVNGRRKSKPGRRAAGGADTMSAVQELFETVREQERSNKQMRDILEKIRDLIDRAL